ncbi:MAG: MFS transporter [Anaerolineae bacterium]
MRDLSKWLLRPKAFYFFYYAALAAISPFLVLFYRSLGLSGRDIGILTGLPPIIALVFGPVWAALADNRGAHRLVILVASGGALVVGYAFSLARGLTALLIITGVYSIFRAPIVALADSAVLNLLGDHKERYGSQRLWGAIGWGLAAPLVGELSQRWGLQYVFITYAVLGLASFISTLYLPTRQQASRQPIWHGLGHLFKQPAWIIFLVTMFLAGMGAATSSNYLFLRMEDLGSSRSLMGIALTVSSCSEIIVFGLFSRMLRAWGSRRLLLMSLAASSVRLLLYSLVKQPIWVLPIQLFHGLAFSLLWSAAVTYADSLAPAGFSASAQAVFGAVQSGLAYACGSLLSGMIYDSAGSTIVFQLASALVAAGFIILLISGARPRRLALPG